MRPVGPMSPDAIVMTDPVNIDAFRRYRVHQERCGNLPKSIVSRQGHLRSFARYLEPRTIFEGTRDDIYTFLDARRARDGRALNSKARYSWISDFHAFYEWAVNEELVALDPTLTVVRPKIRRTLPRPIDDGELADALRRAPPQMRAILSLEAYQGLRCQEIAGIERDDVLEAKGLLRVVKGKGGHERILPLHPEALAALRCLPMPRDGVLFSRPMGGRFKPSDMSVAIRKYLREVGIQASAHQLRHWLVRHWRLCSHPRYSPRARAPRPSEP